MGVNLNSGGNRRGRSTRSAGGFNEINITPFVDVMLVLLIIFMVTAPLIQKGVKVDLPEAKAAPVEANEKKLVLSVDAKQRVFLGDVEVPLDDLEEKLRTNAKAQADKEIFLHADRSLPYGVVVEVMAAAQRAGIGNLGMITDPVSSGRKKGAPAR